MGSFFSALKSTALSLKQNAIVVYFCARDARTPVYLRLLAFSIAAYAFSPIDLIPDFIPVIGILDDLLLIPLGVALIIRFTPPDVLDSARSRALQVSQKPVSYIAGFFIVILWLLAVLLFLYWMFGWVFD